MDARSHQHGLSGWKDTREEGGQWFAYRAPAAGRWNRWRRDTTENRAPSSRGFGPSHNTAVQEPESTPVDGVGMRETDPAVAEIQCIKEQMVTLNKVISSLQDREDPIANNMRASAETDLRNLRISITRTKTTEEQVKTLESLVEKRMNQFQDAKEKLAAAQERAEWSEKELVDAQQQLADVMEQQSREEDANRNVDAMESIKGAHMQVLFNMTEALSPDRAKQARDALNWLMPALQAVGITPLAARDSPQDSPAMKVDADPYGTPSDGQVLSSTPAPVISIASPLLDAAPGSSARGRSAAREAATMDRPRSRSASKRQSSARRCRSKTCMPVGFPVDRKLASAMARTTFQPANGEAPT